MYALDTNAARKADAIGGSIREIGKYIGTFTQAEDIVANSGTRGVALSFDANGQKARLSLYTIMTDGKKIMGFDALMAILTVLNVKNIKPLPGKVKRWDYDANAEVIEDGKIFPELCGKPIGLLLETEDYTSNSGELKTRMVLKGVFQAGTELTASEIIDRKTAPEQLPRMVAALRHHPLKIQKRTSLASEPSNYNPDFDAQDDRMPWEQ